VAVYFLGEATEPPERTIRYVRQRPEIRKERDVN
jgi:hypothetical protein